MAQAEKTRAVTTAWTLAETVMERGSMGANLTK